MAYSLPSAEEFAASVRRQDRRFLIWGGLLALVTGAASAISPALGPVLLLCLLAPLLLWHYPRLSLYVILIAACTFEVLPIKYKDDITSKIPLFWNINTIFQRYAHVDLKAAPVNGLEMLLCLAGTCSLVRAVFLRSFRLRVGGLFWPIAAYVAFVCCGFAIGVVTGGDFKICLMEVRTQFYFLLAYLLAVNLLRETRHLDQAFWMVAICVGIKGVLYTFRRYVTLHGAQISDQGVGSHEEVFFFDAFVILLAVLSFCGSHQKLRRMMWWLLPFVILGNLACNRRAGTAAVVVALLFLLAAAFRALPERRKMITWVVAVAVIGGPIYVVSFQNSKSILGQPARALKSAIAPDERDATSNAYRDAENYNLMATIHLAPIQGYGYGKHMLYIAPMDDISRVYKLWDVMTHNSVLWIWMRVGSFGFLAFWVMIARMIIYGCQIARSPNADTRTRLLGIFSPLMISMLVTIGLLDMLLFDMRALLFTGFFVGAMEVAPRLMDAKSTLMSRSVA